MTEAQTRADMEALMARLMQTQQALLDTRQQVAAAPRAAAPLVNTRTVVRAPRFTGEHKDLSGHSKSRHTWSPLIPQVDGSTTMGCDGREHDHSRSGESTELRGSQLQLYLALALLRKGSAL